MEDETAGTRLIARGAVLAGASALIVGRFVQADSAALFWVPLFVIVVAALSN
jgi:hypothetical protein